VADGFISDFADAFKPGFRFLTPDSDDNKIIWFAKARSSQLRARRPFQRVATDPVRPRVDIRDPQLPLLRLNFEILLPAPLHRHRNCSALRSPYPAGDGSAAIFRSMPANSRRVRCPSANYNQ